VVEYKLKKIGLLTAKTSIERKPYQLTLKNITLYLPLNQQELAVVKIPQFIATYSIASMMQDKLEKIIIPVAEVEVPFYFVATQTDNVNEQIDYKGLEEIRPVKELSIKQVNIDIKDPRHNIKGFVTGTVKVIGLTSKERAFIQSQWQIKPLEYKGLLTIEQAQLKINGKFIPRQRITELDISADINSAKTKRFALKNLIFNTTVKLSDHKEKTTGNFVLEKLYVAIGKWQKNPLFLHGDVVYHDGLYGKINFTDHLQFFTGLIQFKGTHYQIAVNSVNFRDNQVLFDKVVPGLNTDSMLVKGKLKIKGEGDFKQYPKTNIAVSGDNFQIEGQRLHVHNLNLDFNIDQLYPLKINKGTLNADKLNYYFPLNKLYIDFSVSQTDNKTALKINQLQTDFAGGQVSIKQQDYIFNQYENDIDVNVKQIQLGELAEIINIDGLKGNCRVGGNINFVIQPITIKIRNGNLQKQSQNCIINYTPKKTPTSLASNKNVDQIMQYLSDLLVSELKINLKTGDGGTTLQASITGKNPQKYEGIAVKLNLNVNGPLQAILTSIFIGNDTVRKVINIQENTQN